MPMLVYMPHPFPFSRSYVHLFHALHDVVVHVLDKPS
jgi:hypothetical protein